MEKRNLINPKRKTLDRLIKKMWLNKTYRENNIYYKLLIKSVKKLEKYYNITEYLTEINRYESIINTSKWRSNYNPPI